MPEIPVFYAGATSPTFADTILIDGDPYDLTGATVTFHMRPVASSTQQPLSGSVTIVPPEINGEVVYNWAVGDLTQGQWVYWWHVVKGITNFDTPEERLDVHAHAPGETTLFGAIAKRVPRVAPQIWALLRDSDTFGGEPALQAKIEDVKYREMKTPPSVAAESALDPFAQDWLAKATVLELYIPAVDTWSNTRVSVRTDRENAQYPDRLETLQEIFRVLSAQVERDRGRFLDIVGEDNVQPKRARSMPKTNMRGVPLLSPDPTKFYSRNRGC